MNTGIIASRYATALLKLVDETSSSAGSGQSSGEVVVAQARAILNTLETLPDLRRAITDPAVPDDKKLSLLEAAVSVDSSVATLPQNDKCHPERSEGSLSPDLRRFFELMIRNGRIGDIALALKSFEDQFDFINSAHNGTHLTKDYIDDFIELDKRFIAGTAEKLDSTAGFGWADGPGGFNNAPQERYNYGRAHFIVFKSFG